MQPGSEFGVERIIDKKTIGDKVLYKVKWVNYPRSKATWEPSNSLKNCQSLIEEFDKQIIRKSQSKMHPSKEDQLPGSLECDQPSRIIYISGGLAFLEWKVRYDGSQPANSMVSIEELLSVNINVWRNFFNSKV